MDVHIRNRAFIGRSLICMHLPCLTCLAVLRRLCTYLLLNIPTFSLSFGVACYNYLGYSDRRILFCFFGVHLAKVSPPSVPTTLESQGRVDTHRKLVTPR